MAFCMAWVKILTKNHIAIDYPLSSHWYSLYTSNSFDLLHSTGQDLQLPRGKGHKRTSRSHMKVPHLTHTPHSHTKDSHSTGITLLFSNSAWVLLRPVELSTFKELWDGTSGLLSLSEKTRKSNHLEMKLQRQDYLLSYLKTLSVGQVGVSISRPHYRKSGTTAAFLWLGV